MAKAVKEIQQQIEGMNATKKNIECMMNFKNVTEIVEDYKYHQVIPKYQRAPGVWSVATRSYYITSLYEGTNISPITVCENEEGKDELTDGLQREFTLCQLLENKIKLPLTIPKDKGGGGYLKDAPEETQLKLKYARVYVNFVKGADAKQRQRIFLNLQKGENLTNGQNISANYGHVFDAIEHVHDSSRLTPYLNNEKDLDWRTITVIFMAETKKSTCISSKNEVPFVELGYSQKFITAKHQKTVMKILDKLADICEVNKKYGLSTSRTLAWYLFFRRNPQLLKENSKRLAKFLTVYHNNISVVRNFVTKNNKEVKEDAFSYHRSSFLRFNSPTEFKLYLQFMEEEYERFTQNKMIEYTEQYLKKEYGG